MLLSTNEWSLPLRCRRTAESCPVSPVLVVAEWFKRGVIEGVCQAWATILKQGVGARVEPFFHSTVLTSCSKQGNTHWHVGVITPLSPRSCDPKYWPGRAFSGPLAGWWALTSVTQERNDRHPVGAQKPPIKLLNRNEETSPSWLCNRLVDHELDEWHRPSLCSKGRKNMI